MEIHFTEPDEIPLPREQVRFRSVQARPYPDGQRVRLEIDITPFQERPNIDIEVLDAAGQEVSSMSVIESLDHHFDLTVHLREKRPAGRYAARLTLFYPDTQSQDHTEVHFDVVPPS